MSSPQATANGNNADTEVLVEPETVNSHTDVTFPDSITSHCRWATGVPLSQAGGNLQTAQVRSERRIAPELFESL